MLTLQGAQLRVGDTVGVWWKPGRDTITALKPYAGPLECLAGARLADFQHFRVGMTIEPGAMFEVFSRTDQPAARYSPHPLDNLE